jgi:hypothetical protein
MASNPLDPSKLQQQSTLVKPPEPLKPAGQPIAQTKTQIAPVQSSLPPMQQTQTAPATVSQAAAAKRDPRFAQAISSKYQKELEQRKKLLGQQQAEYEQKIREAGFKGDSSRIGELLGTITGGTDQAAIQAAEQEYQTLMRAQAGSVEDPEEYRRAQAKLAALGRLSGAGIAKMYGTSAPGVVAPETFYSVSSPELEQQRQIGKMALREAEQQNILTEALKEQNVRQAEAIRQMSGEQLGAKQGAFLSALEKEREADIKTKEEASNLLKQATLLGTELDATQKEKIKNALGLSQEELDNLGYLNLGEIEGLGEVKDLGSLETTIRKLEEDRESGKPLTFEQEELLGYYKNLTGALTRKADVGSLAYLSKDKEANINALRRLRGETELSQAEREQLGTGKEAGRLSGSKPFTTLIQKEKEKDALYSSYDASLNTLNKLNDPNIAFNNFFSTIKTLVGDLTNSPDPALQDMGRRLEPYQNPPSARAKPIVGDTPKIRRQAILDEIKNYLTQRSRVFKKK